MDCPKCQFDNREGVKFCEECGAKLELICSDCGAEIPLGRKFCGECGHSFTAPSVPPPGDLSPEDEIAKIQRYRAQGLADKILSQGDKIEGERKNVTYHLRSPPGSSPPLCSVGSSVSLGPKAYRP